jgi:hypothetical protein
MAKSKPKQRKPGALSDSERAYLAANRDSMTVEEMAEALGRNVRTVEKNLLVGKAVAPPGERVEMDVTLKELRRSALYRGVKAEMTDDEVVYFEEQYCRYHRQFREDLTHSEVGSIAKAIRYEVLMHRLGRQAKSFIERAEQTRKMLKAIVAKHASAAEVTKEDRDRAFSLELQADELMKRSAATTSEFVKLESEHDRLMESLRATRKQRVDKSDVGTRDYLSLIRQLTKDDEREREARELEFMRRSISKEVERLSAPFEFPGGASSPLITPETVASKDDDAGQP